MLDMRMKNQTQTIEDVQVIYNVTLFSRTSIRYIDASTQPTQ